MADPRRVPPDRMGAQAMTRTRYVVAAIALLTAAAIVLLTFATPAVPTTNVTTFEDGSYRVTIGDAVEFSGCIPDQLCDLDEPWSYAP